MRSWRRGCSRMSWWRGKEGCTRWRGGRWGDEHEHEHEQNLMAVLLLETLHADAEALLRAHAPVHLAASPTDPGPDIPWSAVDAILTRGRGKVTPALLDRCPRLRVVARAGVGL